MTTARTQQRLRLAASVRPVEDILRLSAAQQAFLRHDMGTAKSLVLARITGATVDGYPIPYQFHRTPGRLRSMAEVEKRFDQAVGALDALIESPEEYGMQMADSVTDAVATEIG